MHSAKASSKQLDSIEQRRYHKRRHSRARSASFNACNNQCCATTYKHSGTRGGNPSDIKTQHRHSFNGASNDQHRPGSPGTLLATAIALAFSESATPVHCFPDDSPSPTYNPHNPPHGQTTSHAHRKDVRAAHVRFTKRTQHTT
ncbi:Hypothetical protein, putative [Bodo saltans]|uniref:Uncharacterized protein n=1 Tax=Bodo saltans TaxID=75058 RepID=A0A0S4J5B1_BODSA|nr:Hypothetical protein, putative [Bodo saltans]|eukprot:CUG83760.1 Hypothetical protein, putative [Bodo saltans]